MVHTMITPIILLVSDFDVKQQLQYLKRSKKMTNADGNEEYTKVWVPIINSGASDEDLLYFVIWFHCAVTIMEWIDGDHLLQNLNNIFKKVIFEQLDASHGSSSNMNFGNQQARTQANDPCPSLAGHANHTWVGQLQHEHQ
jgi:hypothetical protein